MVQHLIFILLIIWGIIIHSVGAKTVMIYNYSTNNYDLIDINAEYRNGKIKIDGYNYTTNQFFDGSVRDNGYGDIYNYDGSHQTIDDYQDENDFELYDY